MARSTTISPLRGCAGSAALEALFLVVVLVLPIWMLLFNMGYAGMRLRDSQNAARLAAYAVLERRTAGESATAAQSGIAASVSGQVFPGESGVVELSVTEGNLVSEVEARQQGILSYLSGMLASASGNTTVVVSVDRTSPFQRFANSDVVVPLTTGGTPFTYCEMDNSEFDPFAAENASSFALDILGAIPGATSYILSPFGGLPTGNDKC